MKTVTIGDVASHADVSKSTVSQYLNKRYDYMGENTKQRIKQAIEELGYSPNIVARSLKQKSTMTIGVIVANILHVFSTQVIRAIEDFCNDSNFHVIVCNADDDPDKERQYIEMLRAKQIDGIIAFPTGGNLKLYQGLIHENYPVVLMDRLLPGISVDSVLLDNEKASLLAVDHLVEHGHEKIGILVPPLQKKLTSRLERVNGCKLGLQQHGIPIREDYLVSTEIDEIQAALACMLAMPDRPTALLALNDRVLIEMLAYAKKDHVQIPEDVALMGIDDVSFAEFYHPALTTVAQPAFAMGKKAAELLLDKIKCTSAEMDKEIYRFEPKLIKRESC